MVYYSGESNILRIYTSKAHFFGYIYLKKSKRDINKFPFFDHFRKEKPFKSSEKLMHFKVKNFEIDTIYYEDEFNIKILI